jgi:Plasmid encoded RepA protein
MTKKRDDEGLIRAGAAMKDLPALKQITPVQMRMIEASEGIREAQPDDIAYQHTVLCQTGLPYRKTDLRTWDARNGRVFLHISAGEFLDAHTEKWVHVPLPYGPKARLVHVHINSEAIRTRSKMIDVEDSLTAFVRKMQNGRDPNGDEIKKYNQQIVSLSSAKIRMAVIDDKASKTAYRIPHGDINISDWHDVWQSKDPRQRSLWTKTVHLTDEYFNSLIQHAVPLDPRAVAALAHSALGLDIYAWLAQRLWRIPDGRPDKVTWVNLHQQFGENYKEIRMFRRNFLKTLADVLSQYPAARIEQFTNKANEHEPLPGGLILKHSLPPIHKKTVQISGS